MSGTMQKAKKTQKGRKIGRNKLSCGRYFLENRKEKNAKKRQQRHQKRIEKFKLRALNTH